MQERYGGVPQQVIEDPELRALFIPTLRADVELLETYRYSLEAPLDCSITAFCGAQDPMVSRAMMEGWKQQTNRSFQLHLIEGGHFFLHSARKQLLDLIRTDSESIRRG